MIRSELVQSNTLFAAALAALLLVISAAAYAAPAHTGTAFQCTGYVTVVDPEHQKLTYISDGTTYLIDTRQAQIRLLTALPTVPETGDLVVGMRVHVDGNLVEGKSVQADSVQVLPYIPPTDSAQTASKPVPGREMSTLVVSGVVVAKNNFANTMIVRNASEMQLVTLSTMTIVQDGTGQHLNPDSVNNGDQVKVTGVETNGGTLSATSLVRQPPAVLSSN